MSKYKPLLSFYVLRTKNKWGAKEKHPSQGLKGDKALTGTLFLNRRNFNKVWVQRLNKTDPLAP